MPDSAAMPVFFPKPEGTDPSALPAEGGSSGFGAANSRLDANVPPPPSDAELVRLRELLFSREMALLDGMRAAFENPGVTTRKVSEVLAEAIRMRSGKDPHLAMALEPVVDAIVKTSLHRRRNDFVNALFPLMGPSIRKSIAESFRSMLDSFSKSVEMAFSWKGLRWRFEAIRSGKPFSEIVMLNTLVYRVEQLFFIHNNTGLVLSHVTGESIEAQDADMVSAMLTAIQDFVRDAFTGGGQEDLHSLQLGDHTIYIEKGSEAYLACVTRGTPSKDFHDRLRATLELMLIEYADALENFSGDTEPFADAVRYLDPCLLSHYVDDDKRMPLWAKALPILLLLALTGWGGYAVYADMRERASKEQAAAEQTAFMDSMRKGLLPLRTEPGLVVFHVDETPTAPWKIFLLKDALARSLEEIFREANSDPAPYSFKTIPFISYDPSIIMRRVTKAIEPPATVTMRFDGKGVLTFAGTAPMSWIVETRDEARTIPGVERVDLAEVRDPKMEQIFSMIREVEETVVEFPLGKDTPVPADVSRLKKIVDTLVELEKITKDMGFSPTLTVYGHADSSGNERRNYEISQARTRTVAAMLYARGSSMPIAMYGMGSDYPKEERGTATEQPEKQLDAQANRRIEFRVHFSLSPSADPGMFRK